MVYNLIKGRFTLWTMKSDHGRGFFSMVRVHAPTFMVRLLKKSVLKALGPSLGVNRMWTKKNDHASKSECADFFLIRAQKGQFKKKFEFDHSLVFSWASLLFTSCQMCRRCGLQSFSQQFLQENERFNLSMFNVIYM